MSPGRGAHTARAARRRRGWRGRRAGPSAAAAADTTTTSEPPISAPDRLQRLIRLELLLVYCYRYVLGSSHPRTHGAQRLAPFVGHEEAHIGALDGSAQGPWRDGAARPATASRPPTATSATAGIGGRLGQLKGERDALYMLLTLEQVTIGAYFVALTKLKDPS